MLRLASSGRATVKGTLNHGVSVMKMCPLPPPQLRGFGCMLLHSWKIKLRKASDWLVLKRQLPNPCLELLSQYPWDIPPLDRGRWQEVHGVGNQMPSCLSHSMKFL